MTSDVAMSKSDSTAIGDSTAVAVATAVAVGVEVVAGALWRQAMSTTFIQTLDGANSPNEE